MAVLDSAGSALSARPEPPLAWGLRTATQRSLPRAHAGRRAPAEGRTREDLTAEDAVFLGAGLASIRGEGRVGCLQKRRRKGAWLPDGPHAAQAWGPGHGSGGSTARLCSLKGLGVGSSFQKE